MLRAFSRRRAEIEASLAEHGTEGPRASEAAALATRQAKDRGINPERLTAEWRERAAALGLTAERVTRLLGRARQRQLDAETVDAVAKELTSAAGLTAQRSSFTRRDVIEAVCDRLPPGTKVDARTLEALADRLLASERVVALVGERDPEEAGTVFRRRDGRALPAAVEERQYSTPEFLALEQRLIGRALASRDAGVGVAHARHIERALRVRPTLSTEQTQMVRALAAGGAGVAVVRGRAGAGKTFALAACHDAWARSGFPVLGASVARHAAQQLQAETRIPSTSMAALIAGLKRGELLPRRVVLVVDEAGMAGTRQLATALDHVEAAGGKLVLVGDDRQLPAIDAGGAFAALARRRLAVELTENRRQKLAWEREAVDQLRAGRAEQALALYRDHDRLVVEPDVEAARERSRIGGRYAIPNGR